MKFNTGDDVYFIYGDEICYGTIVYASATFYESMSYYEIESFVRRMNVGIDENYIFLDEESARKELFRIKLKGEYI